jgi:hypothetical protein
MTKRVYLVLQQPDQDWDYAATVIGVFSTRKKAEDAINGLSRCYVYCLNIDERQDITGYFPNADQRR